VAADDPRIAAYEQRIAELDSVISSQAELIERQQQIIGRLEERVTQLERQLGQNSGNSGKPPSRDPAAERQRQAEERKRRAGQSGGTKPKRGKQCGAKGAGPQMSANPDEVIDHRPDRCEDCGGVLDPDDDNRYQARQVIELPEVRPHVTEHRAHALGCACGHVTQAAFPEAVRAPLSYGPRVRATVAYLLGRQPIPGRRVAEAMRDLFALEISTGTIDAIYSEASRRLRGFIAALVAVLGTLPVLHADETTDRIGTTNCWMHVVSTGAYTLIHASATRGGDAIDEAGVLRGYRGVIIHDRLAMYWKLKRAKHGLCGAHLLRDLADVALVATQTAWATGLAALLVEANAACEAARLRGLRQLAPARQRAFAARYDDLVAAGVGANPDPGRKRDYLERRSQRRRRTSSTRSPSSSAARSWCCCGRVRRR
jgi:transposase